MGKSVMLQSQAKESDKWEMVVLTKKPSLTMDNNFTEKSLKKQKFDTFIALSWLIVLYNGWLYRLMWNP